LLRERRCCSRWWRLRESCGRRRSFRGASRPFGRSSGIGSDRAVALLVALAAAAGTGIVAADKRTAGNAGFGTREQRTRFMVFGQCVDAATSKRRGRIPLSERYAVAKELAELNGARDRVGKLRCERGQLGGRHDAAEIVETVKAERHAGRVRRFEREAIRERLARVTDAVVALEQRAERAADRDVFGLGELDSFVPQRFEQFSRSQRKSAVGYADGIVEQEGRGTGVIGFV